MEPERTSAIDLARGDTLVDCAITQHVALNGKRTDIDVFLRFVRLGWLEVRGAPNGIAIEVKTSSEPEGYHMGEAGRVLIGRESNLPHELANLIGKQLVDVKWVVLPNTTDPIGFEMQFVHEESVLVFNWGDNLIVSATLPTFVREAGGSVRE